MKVAIESGFDIILTEDKNLQHQQNLKEYDISIILIGSCCSAFEYITEGSFRQPDTLRLTGIDRNKRTQDT